MGLAGDNAVARYRLEANGRLTLQQQIGFPGVAGKGSSTPMAWSADHRRLYVGYRGVQPRIIGFEWRDGMLAAHSQAEVSAPPAYISVLNSSVLGASYVSGVITRNPLASDGSVLPTAQVLDIGPKAHAVADAGGELLVASLGTDRVLQLGWQNGQLTVEGPRYLAAAQSGPRHFVKSRTGILYVVNELSASVDVFGPDRQIRQSVHLIDGAGRGSAADIHLVPDETALFASERRTGTISAFVVRADGGLDPGHRVETEPEPRGFAIDPSGVWLVAAGTRSHRLAVFRINGAMLVPAGMVETGSNPNWIEIV
ncbi:MAG: 6-phosphogluconolactonase [Devosia sp.]|nr:6-phosphogluconolactonase [Devosia sp.]